MNFSFVEPNLPAAQTFDQNVQLFFHHQINPNWKLTAQVGYFDFFNNGSSLWMKNVDTNGTAYQTLGGCQDKGKILVGQLFINGSWETGPVHHNLLAGIDLGNKYYIAYFPENQVINGIPSFNVHNPIYGNVPNDSVPRFHKSTPLKSRANWYDTQTYLGLYVQDELGFFNNILRITAGGRITTVSQATIYGRTGAFPDRSLRLTPRLGLSRIHRPIHFRLRLIRRGIYSAVRSYHTRQPGAAFISPKLRIRHQKRLVQRTLEYHLVRLSNLAK